MKTTSEPHGYPSKHSLSHTNTQRNPHFSSREQGAKLSLFQRHKHPRDRVSLTSTALFFRSLRAPARLHKALDPGHEHTGVTVRLRVHHALRGLHFRRGQVSPVHLPETRQGQGGHYGAASGHEHPGRGTGSKALRVYCW